MSTGGEESGMVMPTKAGEDKAVKVSVTLYPEELAALAKEAKTRRLSRSTVLRMIVQDWIKTRRRKTMQISLNNGYTFMDADEAIEKIEEQDLWQVVVETMDPEVRERVHGELAPCSNLAFLRRYLELAAEDLIIG